MRVYERRRWLRIELDSMHSPTLFNAVSDAIEKVAERQSDTCSSDVEAFTEYDKPTGRTQVRMRFWGCRSRTVYVKLVGGRGSREMKVVYDRGDDVVCGRDQSVQHRERLVLRLPASRDRLTDKMQLKEDGRLLTSKAILRH